MRNACLVDGQVFCFARKFCKVNLAQIFECELHRIETRQERIKILRRCGIRPQVFDFRLDTVCHLTKPQGTGKTRTTLECVQGTQNFHARALIVRASCPLTQGTTELRHELDCFLVKEWEKFLVNGVNCIDLIIFVASQRRGGSG